MKRRYAEAARLLSCVSGKGVHDIWYSPVTGINVTVDGKIKSRHTANAIMKQAGINFKFS